ncbi:hypothetical protein [Streptomyces silvensis]|uniref:hypothetical protein n=1 Tax=Streptomyces silvensis TaxID=1765722 RepID=UPI000B1314CB|nr:hypothetical protein [Streptomyces silvensis]
MKASRTRALRTPTALSRRQALGLGAAAVAAAGVPGLAAPEAYGLPRARARASDGGTYSDGSTYMAWRGLGGDQRIFWNGVRNDGGWTGPQPVPGAFTSGGVALAGPSGGALHMAWKGVEGDERIFWNRLDGTTWSGPEPVPGALTKVGPALAPYAGVLMAWRGLGGDQRVWWNSRFGRWTAPQVVPGALTGFGPALAVDHIGTYGVPRMAWRGADADERIWWNTYRGGDSGTNDWTGPQPVPGALTSAGVALAGPPGGGLHMAWKGAGGDERIWWSRLHAGSTAWTAPQPVPGALSSVGPALAVYSGSVYMTWKGAGGDERIWWSRFPATTWTPPQPVDGALTAFRPALATIGN